MGRAIKRAAWKRENLVISTKLFWGGKQPNDVGLSRKHLTEGHYPVTTNSNFPDFTTP